MFRDKSGSPQSSQRTQSKRLFRQKDKIREENTEKRLFRLKDKIREENTEKRLFRVRAKDGTTLTAKKNKDAKVNEIIFCS